MEHKNPIHAFVAFWKGLGKATFVCEVSLLAGVAGCVFVGDSFAKALAVPAKVQPWTTNLAIAVEVIALWLIAFAAGVRARPNDPRDTTQFYEYPPARMMRGAMSSGWVLYTGLGFGAGYFVVKVGVLNSLAWSVLGPVALSLIMGVAWAASAPGTLAKATGRHDVRLMADAFQRTWLFAGTALFILYGILHWLAGTPAESSTSALTLHAATASAVYITGYAAGYYP
jgi:hypothetical protein